MKLLKLNIKNYKLLNDDFTFNLTPIGQKSIEDKEYELNLIAPNLYTFKTIAIVGKNASGKTTTTEALAIAYDILSNFKIKNTLENIKNNHKDIYIELYFYHDNYLYYYKTLLEYDIKNDYVKFKDEKLYKREYFKSYSNNLFDLTKYKIMDIQKLLPDDTSIIYNILNEIFIRGSYYHSEIEKVNLIDRVIDFYNNFNNPQLLNAIITLLDEHIKEINMKNNNKFIITYADESKETKTKNELFSMLSSGTIKGLFLYLDILVSIYTGSDYIIDEIEIHFHKTLVENIINLYKDKKINILNATLIFTTHYPELLNLTSRTDNIYICKYQNKIILENMYNYKLRNDAIKSKKFYENNFNTAINYEALMNFKKEILK